MYEIRFRGSKVKKQFLKLIQNLSPTLKKRLREALENTPYPNSKYGTARNMPSKIEKKGNLYCYEITGGGRILYDILNSMEVVLIHFAGNHDEEIRYLKKFSK